MHRKKIWISSFFFNEITALSHIVTFIGFQWLYTDISFDTFCLLVCKNAQINTYHIQIPWSLIKNNETTNTFLRIHWDSLSFTVSPAYFLSIISSCYINSISTQVILLHLNILHHVCLVFCFVEKKKSIIAIIERLDEYRHLHLSIEWFIFTNILTFQCVKKTIIICI